MAYGKLNTDGTLISSNTKIDDSFKELSLFETDENGNYYEVYKTDGSNEPDLVAIKAIEDIKQAIIIKANKKKQLDTLTVIVNNNEYDANDKARLNMLAAIQASDITGITESNWKLADNTIKLVKLDEIKEALTLGITKAGEIIIGATDE